MIEAGAPAPSRDRRLVWASADASRIEHCVFARDGFSWVADGMIVGTAGDLPVRLQYVITLDREFRARQVSVDLQGRTPVRLKVDQGGLWLTGLSEPLPELTECLDVDIQVSAFTNTGPIRRLGLGAGEQRTIRALYLGLPDLKPVAFEQTYHCVRPYTEGEGLYRYESATSGGPREIVTDGDGLVVSYAGAFHRTAAL